jgi:hypothetical protein
LTDGIGGQYYKTLQSQIGGGSLRLGLSLLSMAGLEKYGGVSAGFIGPVDVTCDIEIRQTLEKHFLNGVALCLNLARHPGIQRPAVVGQATQEFQKLYTDLLFPALRLGHRVDLVYHPLALLQLPLRDLVHPAEERVVNGLLRREGARDKKHCTQYGDFRQFHEVLPRLDGAKQAAEKSVGIVHP